MAWVYILKTKANKFYIGSTPDLERRFKQHLQKHTHTTTRLVAQEVILKQEYKALADARAVEYKLKKLKRRDYIEKIVKEGYIKIQP